MHSDLYIPNKKPLYFNFRISNLWFLNRQDSIHAGKKLEQRGGSGERVIRLVGPRQKRRKSEVGWTLIMARNGYNSRDEVEVEREKEPGREELEGMNSLPRPFCAVPIPRFVSSCAPNTLPTPYLRTRVFLHSHCSGQNAFHQNLRLSSRHRANVLFTNRDVNQPLNFEYIA